jgi:excisionase family DNA binding protein
MNQKFLSPAEVCLHLGISSATLARQLRAGTIPKVKLARRILIPSAWVESLEQEALAKIDKELPCETSKK